MKQGEKITTRISAFFLLVLLLFPIVSEATHAFSDHEHPICTAITTHLHELEPDCSICDFHHTPWAFNLTEFSLEIPSIRIPNTYTSYTNPLRSKLLFTRGQRGPPSLS